MAVTNHPTLERAYTLLRGYLDTAPVLTIHPDCISIVNETFNAQQTRTIINVCRMCSLNMVLTVQPKRIHESVEITLTLQ